MIFGVSISGKGMQCELIAANDALPSPLLNPLEGPTM